MPTVMARQGGRDLAVLLVLLLLSVVGPQAMAAAVVMAFVIPTGGPPRWAQRRLTGARTLSIDQRRYLLAPPPPGARTLPT